MASFTLILDLFSIQKRSDKLKGKHFVVFDRLWDTSQTRDD